MKMKKKIAMIVFMGILCLGLLGCGKKDSPAAKDGMENPIKEVKKEELERVGVEMEEPDGAADMNYYIIGDETAQITFTLGGHEYIYRGARTEEDISGIYEEFEGDSVSYNISEDGHNAEVTLKKTTEGAYLATWMWENISYSLYTADVVSDQIITELFTELAEDSCPDFS